MKMSSIFATGLAMALCLALVSVTATAQETQTKKNRDRSQIGTLDNKTSGASFRASKLIGMNIQNELGKSVGKVNDMVLDASTGKVRYLAVTYGGFLHLLSIDGVIGPSSRPAVSRGPRCFCARN